MLRLALSFLMAYLTSVIPATCQEGLGTPKVDIDANTVKEVIHTSSGTLPLGTTLGLNKPPKVLIDGYTVKENFDSESPEANLPLGTTLVLVCRASGISLGVTRNFTWTCPNGPCEPRGYLGRMIKNDTLAINITSVRDNGTYTCNVSAEGYKEGSEDFHLKVTGGEVVHSFGRLIVNEAVISKRKQLQPPNNRKGDGRIECRVSNGTAWISYYGAKRTLTKVKQTLDPSGFNSTVVIKRTALSPKKFAIEGKCAGLYHYLFLKKDANCSNLTLDHPRVTDGSITVTINNPHSGIVRYIVGYARLVHGVWVEGEYANLRPSETRTFSSLISGAEYRVTAWGLSGGNTDDRKRCRSPTVIYVSTPSQPASPPRAIVVTGDGNMHWIQPKVPNGDISHFKIKYTLKNGTQQEINTPYNYHTLTGMEIGHSYNITLMAVHKDGLEGESVMKTYVYYP